MPSIADQNISPNRRPSKRTRDEDHDDIDDHYSSPSSSSKSSNSRSATINAAIRYRCEKQSDITPRLQELVCAFSSGQINRVRFHFAKGSFVIDPCNRDIYILVHLRRSVPWTKWDKIRSNSGGDEVIMKPADSWCNFYAFMMDRCSAFSCIERMVDNEDVFQHLAYKPEGDDAPGTHAILVAEPAPKRALVHKPSSSIASTSSSSSPSIQPATLVFQQDYSSAQPQFILGGGECSMDSTSSSSTHQQPGELGLLDLAQIAPILDVRPDDAPPHADIDLCRDFLASASSPTGETLDAITRVVGAFFSSLPNQRGRFCEALLLLPALDVIVDALRLESAVLHAVASFCGLPPVHNFLALDVAALATRFPVQVAVGSLMLKRQAAFEAKVLLLDRTSTLFLLVVHMMHELHTPQSQYASPPLIHFTKNMIQDLTALMHWRTALADFARWAQSVGMDSAGGIAQCLSQPVHLPDVWRSAKLPQDAAANHAASIQQQASKVRSKAEAVGARLGIAVEECFASTVFWRMQDNASLVAGSLFFSSPLLRMLPPSSFSASPADHAEDPQALLYAVQFPLVTASSSQGGGVLGLL